jgi:2-oxoglutarate ferredoxin oxidoreductase subunit beta
MSHPYDRKDIDNAWCPGCGNFGILKILKEALEELQIEKERVVIVSGIGQASKTPFYIDINMFGGLHGRAVPVATAVKVANPSLCVIAEGGDGDMYGEGGNHFMHAVRRNVDLVHIVHNNMVYGLTKGQASPTTPKGQKTPVQVEGVISEPFNPVAVALALNAGFVSRVSITDKVSAKAVLKEALQHPGYALVDIFQPCPSFNKLNTFGWFKENTYLLESDYDISDRMKAMEKALEFDPFPLGIFYKEVRPTFETQIRRSRLPLHETKHDLNRLNELFGEY